MRITRLFSGKYRVIMIVAIFCLIGAVDGSMRHLYHYHSGPRPSLLTAILTYIPVWLVAGCCVLLLSLLARHMAGRAFRPLYAGILLITIPAFVVVTLSFSTVYISVMRGRSHSLAVFLEIFLEDLVRLGVLIAFLYLAMFIIIYLADKNSRQDPENKEAPNSEGGQPERLLLKEGYSLVPVDVADIQWIEAAGNYVLVHRTSGETIARMSMKQAEEKLSGGSFFRVHRSAIVNLDQVREFDHATAAPSVLLESGEMVKVSRSKIEPLKQLLSRA
jgi:hypothetical protein